MHSRWLMLDRALAVITTVAAVVIAAAMWAGGGEKGHPNTGGRIEYREGWRAALGVALPESSKGAPVTILEFVDLQCPSCARFAEVLREVKAKFGAVLDIKLVNYPLEQHEHAFDAALSLVCADQAGVGLAYADTVFAMRKSLGSVPWSVFAKRGGIADTSRFSACMRRPETRDAVDSARAVGQRLLVPGTPSVFVNGWQLRGPLSAEFVSAVVSALLTGKDPVKAAALRDH